MSDLVESELDEDWSSGLSLLVVLLVLGSLGKSCLLVLWLLWWVVSEKSEKVLSYG